MTFEWEHNSIKLEPISAFYHAKIVSNRATRIANLSKNIDANCYC
jgi:hypothetical protein